MAWRLIDRCTHKFSVEWQLLSQRMLWVHREIMRISYISYRQVLGAAVTRCLQLVALFVDVVPQPCRMKYITGVRLPDYISLATSSLFSLLCEDVSPLLSASATVPATPLCHSGL